jgi:16S rRNA C967 or C1407 C5-methylase (RsmB/RsmF family)/NOL1/NOP2/fmu family ribosome biogenesis protein
MNDTTHILPPLFIQAIEAMPQLQGLAHTLSTTDAQTSVRVNTAKGATVPQHADMVPWCDKGFYIAQRPAFTFDPALHQGLYYVQDASSMVIANVISFLRTQLPDQPLTYLDACAAPGGKTTAAIDSLPQGSLVVANEFDTRRASILLENLERWGSPDIIVTQGDTDRLTPIGPTFDIIAADVPCSGEGMMRKEPTAITQWSPALVASCATLQRQIIQNIWPTLKPGGFLIYSTCTFNRQENEENLQWIVDTFNAQPIDTLLTQYPGVIPGIDTQHPCARFIPGHIRGEGLFIAVVRKPLDSDTHRHTTKNDRRKTTALDPNTARQLAAWLNRPLAITPLPDGRLTAIDTRHQTIARQLAANTRILIAGLHIADQTLGAKKTAITPTHSLILNTALAHDAFPRKDIDYTTAISYLRRETPEGQPDSPRGHLLLTYRNHPLGLIKNLGNRANTLLPTDRRILSPTTPDTPVSLLP